MSRARFFATLGTVLLGLGAAIPDADAQSLFAGRGLGYVIEPLDARAQGLGGVGLGLPEPSLSLINPAGVAGLPASALHVTLQPDQFDSTLDGDEFSTTTVRFPVIHAALPFRRWTATIGYASYLDRNWAAQSDTTLDIGGRPIDVVDRFASHGGVARLRIGAAYAVGPRLAIGAAADVFSGSVRDTVYRIFDDPVVNPTIRTSSFTFRGVGGSAGVRWVPSEAFALDAAISGGGELEVRGGVDESTRRFDLPLQAAFGASGRLTPGLMLAVGSRWSGWSSVDEAFRQQGGARDTWTMAGGVEWEALRVGGRVVPLRVGARHSLLPFRWENGGDGEWANERAFTGGTGLHMGGGAARFDASVERGERGGADIGLTERFWRMAFSLTVLGR